MARRIHLLAPSAIACVIFGCGGAGDPGLFSAGGGNSGVSGASSAGAASIPNAGSTAAGGDTSNAGSGDAGADSAGGNSSAGSDSGGASEAGHSGSGGSINQAGAGGSAGHAEGGSAGHAEGGSAGHAEGGSGWLRRGRAGAGSGSGGKGSAGGGNEPTCAELFTQAATELTAARACNVDANAEQCTGKVETTCNCQLPVEKDDSPATKAYQATLKQLQSKHCSQVCPAIACTPVFNPQCRATTPGDNKGTCVASFPVGTCPLPKPAL